MKTSNRSLYLIIAIWLGAIVIFHLWSAAAGYPQYRDMHLGTALEYAKGRIDLLRPIIVGFNATNTPTPQEFPLWQAAAALMLKTFGPWLGWTNLISLLLFATGLWPLFQLTAKYLGNRAAGWTLLFFLFQPLVFLYAGIAGTDGFVLACTIWFIYFADQCLNDPRAHSFVASAFFGAVVAVSKLPYFMSAGFTLTFLLLASKRQTWQRWMLLILIGLLGGLVFLVWSRYCDRLYSQALFPEVDLRLRPNSDTWFWFFGNWQSRLSLFNWGKGGWAALNSLFGSLALVALAASSLLFFKNQVGRAWLGGALLTTLVFSHLVLAHHHYYLMFAPAIAILCGQATQRFEEDLVSRNLLRSPTFILIALPILLLSILQGLIGIKTVLGYDPYAQAMARLLQDKTSPGDKLLIQGGGWGGDLLFRSGRSGLSMIDTAILEDPRNVARLKELGFNKLVMINETPLVTAAQKINPGSIDLKRLTFEHFITPTPAGWPVIFQNEDMLIKSVP